MPHIIFRCSRCRTTMSWTVQRFRFLSFFVGALACKGKCPPWCHCRSFWGWKFRNKQCLGTRQTRNSVSSSLQSSEGSGWRTRSSAQGSPWYKLSLSAPSPNFGKAFWSPRACGGFTWVLVALLRLIGYHATITSTSVYSVFTREVSGS